MEEMLFKRKLYDKMLQWKQERDGKTALLIKGARRVGKSTLAEEFAQREFAFDGSDRTQLCEEIWNVASPKVDYYWRDGTFDALEELRTKELYNRKYGNGRSI